MAGVRRGIIGRQRIAISVTADLLQNPLPVFGLGNGVVELFLVLDLNIVFLFIMLSDRHVKMHPAMRKQMQLHMMEPIWHLAHSFVHRHVMFVSFLLVFVH